MTLSVMNAIDRNISLSMQIGLCLKYAKATTHKSTERKNRAHVYKIEDFPPSQNMECSKKLKSQ